MMPKVSMKKVVTQVLRPDALSLQKKKNMIRTGNAAVIEKLYKKACDGGVSAEGCFKLAEITEDNNGASDKIEKLYEQVL